MGDFYFYLSRFWVRYLYFYLSMAFEDFLHHWIYLVVIVETGAWLSDRKGTEEQSKAKQESDRA